MRRIAYNAIVLGPTAVGVAFRSRFLRADVIELDILPLLHRMPRERERERERELLYRLLSRLLRWFVALG